MVRRLQPKQLPALPAAVVMLLGMSLSLGCGSKPTAPPPSVRPVKTMVLGEAGIGTTRTFPGRVEASRKVELAFQVSGPLLELPAVEGQPVKAGDLLAKIDPRDFDTALKNAQATLEESQAQLTALRAGARPEDRKTLEAQRNAAKATLDKALADFNRVKILRESNTASQEEYDGAVADWNLARAELEKAEQELAKGMVGARVEDILAKEAEVKRLQASVEDAQNARDDTELRAPFDGLVANRYVENFENVQAQQPIVMFQDVAQIEIIIDIPESDTQMKPGSVESATVRFPFLPGREFEATLKEFSSRADPDTQTFQVRLAIRLPEGEDLRLLPGSSGTVVVRLKPEAGDGADAISVPLTAVAETGGEGPFVWVLDSEGKVHRQEVTLGEPADGNVAIISGLKPGQTIVTAGVHELEEGMKVRPMK